MGTEDNIGHFFPSPLYPRILWLYITLVYISLLSHYGAACSCDSLIYSDCRAGHLKASRYSIHPVMPCTRISQTMHGLVEVYCSDLNHKTLFCGE